MGGEPKLVLHGGGNASVKTVMKDLLDEEVEVLCVKGSGWDMAAIEPAGLPAVRLAPLRKLRGREALSDEEMVRVQRANLLDPGAPNPSVETLLHAFLPHKYVDHTHSTAVLSLADQPDATERCADLYGRRMGLITYIMPGCLLAKKAAEVFEETQFDRLLGGDEEVEASFNRLFAAGKVVFTRATNRTEDGIYHVNLGQPQLAFRLAQDAHDWVEANDFSDGDPGEAAAVPRTVLLYRPGDALGADRFTTRLGDRDAEFQLLVNPDDSLAGIVVPTGLTAAQVRQHPVLDRLLTEHPQLFVNLRLDGGNPVGTVWPKLRGGSGSEPATVRAYQQKPLPDDTLPMGRTVELANGLRLRGGNRVEPGSAETIVCRLDRSNWHIASPNTCVQDDCQSRRGIWMFRSSR